MAAIERYYSGWDFRKLGAFVFELTNDGTGFGYTATITTGQHYHPFDDDAGVYTDFATAFQTELNAQSAAAGSAVTWTVTYSNATMKYTISGSAGAWSATLNSNAQNILGFPSLVFGLATQISTSRPWYVLEPTIRARAEDSLPRTMPGRRPVTMRDDGQPVAVGPHTVPRVRRWVQRDEREVATYTTPPSGAAASATVPFTWERFFAHHWDGERFATVRVTTAAASYTTEREGPYGLVDGGNDFGPVMVFQQYADSLDIALDVVEIG